MKKKSAIIISSILLVILFIGALVTLFVLPKEKTLYPEIQDMSDFRRSFSNDGEAFVTSGFDESIIKSAVIAKGHLVKVTETNADYVIYEFDIIDSIKNIEGDTKIRLYEPKLEDGTLLYDLDVDYVLLLARTTDVYYMNPIFFNFGEGKITVKTDGNLGIAEAKSGQVNLKDTYQLKTYEDLKDYVKKVRENNHSIKDGIYSYHGRFIDSENYDDIVLGADYVLQVTLEEVLYENLLMRESLFNVDKKYKGTPEDKVIITIPSYVELTLGDSYVVCLFKDGNYTVAARSGIIALKDTPSLELVMKSVSLIIEEEEEEEEIVIIPEAPKEREYVVNETYIPYVEINEDMIGWFKIEDTNIDYPVLQGEDNSYYLKHNLEDEEYNYGSIILDYRCDIKNIQRNTMVYGHNMKQEIMFHEIVYYKNKDYFDAHPIIEFNTLYDSMKWEVFAIHVVDGGYVYSISYPLTDDEEFAAYLADIKERNMFQTDIEVTLEDKLLTLVTCSYEFDNARTILHARLIQE